MLFPEPELSPKVQRAGGIEVILGSIPNDADPMYKER